MNKGLQRFLFCSSLVSISCFVALSVKAKSLDFVPKAAVKTQKPPDALAVPLENHPDIPEQQMQDSLEIDSSFAQVNAVSQLSDVQPTDWAFQALQSLVERYSCVAGYPDRVYRGDWALTRYEFAVGLSACLDRVDELVKAATTNLVKQEDLTTLQTLQEQFAAELGALRGRVNALETRTATLEKQQFSTTTKLVGEVIFAVTDEFSQPVQNNSVLQSRVRLDLQTSFRGTDTLHTRIAAGNANVFATPGGGAEGVQTFNFGNTVTNAVQIDWASYFFPVGQQIQAYIAAVGGVHFDYAPTIAGASESYDAGTTALTGFGQRSPIYYIGGGSGGGLTYTISTALALSIGYLADNATFSTSAAGSLNFAGNQPAAKNGLFNGSYGALAQLTLTPSDQLTIGLTYVNAYRRFAIFDAGSALASSGTGLANGVGLAPAKVNAYGAEAAFRVSPQFTLNGWIAYVDADFVGLGKGDLWTYGLSLSFPDLGRKGDLGGIAIGVEPYLGNASRFKSGARNDLPLHIEGFYKYQLNDNISITPGVIWVLSPGQDSGNADVLIGTLRTTFTF